MDSFDEQQLDAAFAEDLDAALTPAPAPAAAPRNTAQLLARIPVRLTLEVGSATVSLAELTELHEGSVIELDRLAGEPLLVKVNNAVVGRAEVVVSGESYGLKVLEIDDLGVLTS